jgi:hypothetical protein
MSTTSKDMNICYRGLTSHFISSGAKWMQPIVPPYQPEHRTVKYVSCKLGISRLSRVWYIFNGKMTWIYDTVTLLRHVNKATQTNSLVKLRSCHNNLICGQYNGDRNHWSNLLMISVYNMLTRDTHRITQVLFTSLPSITFLPSSDPQDISDIGA